MIQKIKSNLPLILVLGLSVVIFLVNLRINFFRYNNFDFGKFDLGNMTQMLWNTLHGRVLYLTDYFGTNLPRWSMSHVDPILLLFVPIFAVFQHPMTLVVSQLVLVIFSSIIIYKIAELELKSKFSACFLACAYLFYPAIGFLTAWTGFHGVTAVIPAFLGAFYVYEKMHKSQKFTKKGLVAFWVLLVLVMMGKEQLPLYIAFYGVFIWLFRQNYKLGLKMIGVGAVWFIVAFFVIIPSFAKYRIEGYNKFATSLGLDTSVTRDVERPNYFLSRYEAFGETYVEVAVNMLLRPDIMVQVFFGGDKLDNLRRTFEPVGYITLAAPQLLIISLPDFLINYLTTEGGIGTAEIYNHRVSMIVPVMFISVIFAISWLSKFLSSVKFLRKIRFYEKLSGWFVLVFSALILGLNIYTTFTYNNPVYLWLTQAVSKRLLGAIALAKTEPDIFKQTDLELGKMAHISRLENKDRECAQKVIGLIPEDASVSGPDYLGAHLSMRETYAIFPALYEEADFVIVDVFSRKILTILDADVTLVRDVVGDLVKNNNYKMALGCGNLFVFQKVEPFEKDSLLPLQQRFSYEEKVSFEMVAPLNVVDYKLPETLTRSQPAKLEFVYKKQESKRLDDYVLFMSFVSRENGEIYQVANLPSFGLTQVKDWETDPYYLETNEVILPSYISEGKYMVFVGMTNNIKNRSVYLGDVTVN
ncbi:MAG: membrane protein-like protein [uncultured bacterium]|nr:MAG: membrane protein-like protein [uncultured bacterium]